MGGRLGSLPRRPTLRQSTSFLSQIRWLSWLIVFTCSVMLLLLLLHFYQSRCPQKKWSKNTFGWARAEVLGALVNSVFLVTLCFSILVESLKRFYEIESIENPKLLLVVGSIGLLINIIGLFLFHDHGHSHGGGGSKAHGHSHGGAKDGDHGHSHLQHGHSHLSRFASINNDDAYPENEKSPKENGKIHSESEPKTTSANQMNMKGVFLHVLADALGSVVVIISALIIWLTEWEYRDYVDPALSVAMVCLIMWSTWPLLQESALILLQTVPTHIQLDDIQRKLISQVDGVLAVHEFHVWQLAGDRIIASAHIRCRNLSDYMKIAEEVKEFFHNEGIHSTTIQPEFTELPDESASETDSCALDCPSKDRTCSASTCCGPSKQGRESPQPEMAINCRQRNPSSVAGATAGVAASVKDDCDCGPNYLSCIEEGVHSALLTKHLPT